MNIIQAIDDPALFGPWFKGPSWGAWRAALRAIFGLPMTKAELATYRACTDRRAGPKEPAAETWLVCGRRSGKSFVLAVIAVFLACFKDWRVHLGPGERGTIMVIATNRRQARVILRYIAGLLEVPMLAARVEGQTAESFDLVNRVTIEVHTANFRSVRGYSIIAALCDELAFWQSDEASASPDREVIDAIRPAMATVPGAMLLCASSPYSRRGVLWDAYRRHHGKGGSALVWVAPTRTMNPRVPQRVIDEAMERDEAVARAEYHAIFRSDLEAFISREVIEALVSTKVFEKPPVSGVRYFGFVDPSGGSADSFCLAIGHREGDVAVLDLLRERKPPFSPEAVTQEYAETLKSYGLTEVTGDRYSAQWVQEQFRKRGINYRVSEKTKSELYLECLPVFNSGRAELLDNQRLIGQFCMLERRTSRAGRDTVDHAPNATDDLSNAAAGVVALCQARRMLKGNVFDYAAVFGGRAAPGADWRPGPGEPGDRTRPGDPGHYTSAPSGGLAVFDDQSSPRAGW